MSKDSSRRVGSMRVCLVLGLGLYKIFDLSSRTQDTHVSRSEPRVRFVRISQRTHITQMLLVVCALDAYIE